MIWWIILIISIVFFIIGILLYHKANNIKIQKRYQQNQAQITDRAIDIKRAKLIEAEKTLDQVQQDIIELNQKRTDALQQYDKRFQDLEVLKTVIQEKNNENSKLDDLIKTKQIEFEQVYEQKKKSIDKKIQDYQAVTLKAANNYCDTLQDDYKDAEAHYRQKIASVQQEYNEAAAALTNLKETRKAAFEAILKQKEVKENKINYCLLPSTSELDDIHTLERVKQTLHKPRILSMLIWQTFWQPIAKKQFPLILKDKTKMGIYKITNLITNECYVGQSVDIYKRWSDHCKAGLGIDTPVGNKLYKSIQEYGLQNFSFELLCQCSKEELDEKERYFIDLYQADVFGYNSTKGNK